MSYLYRRCMPSTQMVLLRTTTANMGPRLQLQFQFQLPPPSWRQQPAGDRGQGSWDRQSALKTTPRAGNRVERKQELGDAIRTRQNSCGYLMGGGLVP